MNASDTAVVEDHERYMRRCIELARIALSQNNTPVGSAVIINGEIVGEGIEELPSSNNLTGHAEVAACQNAVDQTGSRSLLNSILYTTAEPCFMCSYIIRQCRVGLVVYGIDTPTIGGITSCHPILTAPDLTAWSPPPRFVSGVLQDEIKKLRTV